MGEEEEDNQLVNIDEGENWTIAFRTSKLKTMGWRGTFPEWRQAMELLDANPLDLDPPATSLEEARTRAACGATGLKGEGEDTF